MGPIWWTLVSVLASTAVVECAAVAKLQMVQHEGTYSKTMSFRFNQTTEHVLVFPTSQSMYPYRISAWSSNATVECPVLLVVRQEREVLSWQIPFVVDTSTRDGVVHFHNTSRTLCHNNMLQITKSSKLDDGTAQLALCRKLYQEAGDTAVAELHRGSVHILHGQRGRLGRRRRRAQLLPDREQEVLDRGVPQRNQVLLLQVLGQEVDHGGRGDHVGRRRLLDCIDPRQFRKSTKTRVVPFLRQSFQCPVFDLDKDITYEGKYQTINRKGGMSIRVSSTLLKCQC
jgi:hypothetical protein